MSHAVRRRGLRTAEVFRSNDPNEVKAWAASRKSWPVVVKPICSAASDNVHLCESEDDIFHAAAEIIGKTNGLGLVNDSVLAQEYLQGTEYVVDTVSLDGRHKVTALWIYERSGNRTPAIGYDTMSLIPYDGPRQDTLSRYAFDVLDALCIRFGPAHCELMWCDGEPILVEIGARLTAGVNAALSGICGGISQLKETVQALLDPAQFHDFSRDQRTLVKHAANVFLLRGKPGRLRRVRREKELRQLKTLYRLSLSMTPGELLSPVAGMVTLVHADSSAIREDIAEIRNLEKQGLFEVENDNES
jgi:biotin carboxylase